jgi:diketogulonate reductase-like aldo/keto reductase
MGEIYQSGRARAVGVSNFMPRHLSDLRLTSHLIPAVNQVEFHPHLVQPELLSFCQDQGIQVEAWSPIMQGQVAAEKTILELARRYQKTPAQITLRWDLQHGVATIPKSRSPDRIAENARIFDFELTQEDMRRLDGLDMGKRLGPDPDDVDF